MAHVPSFLWRYLWTFHNGVKKGGIKTSGTLSVACVVCDNIYHTACFV